MQKTDGPVYTAVASGTKKDQLQLIQVLRGIAAVLVVLFHASGNFRLKTGQEFLGGFFMFGNAGVDLFFVLSGFIITYTSQQMIQHRSNYLYFLQRRAIRIFPVYWIVCIALLLLLVISPVYKLPYKFTAGNLLSTFLLLPGHTMVNGVSWTLTHELFFYVLFLAAFFVRPRTVLFPLVIAYATAILILYFSGTYAALTNEWLHVALSPLTIEFFLGVGTALLIRHMSVGLAIPCVITGALWFVAGGVLMNNGYIKDGPAMATVIFGVPSALLILGCVSYEKKAEVKPWPVFLSLGNASYSLYLLHLPVVAAISKVCTRFSGNLSFLNELIMIAGIAGVCFFSIIFFNRVENPLIRKLNRRIQKNNNVAASVPPAPASVGHS